MLMRNRALRGRDVRPLLAAKRLSFSGVSSSPPATSDGPLQCELRDTTGRDQSTRACDCQLAVTLWFDSGKRTLSGLQLAPLLLDIGLYAGDESLKLRQLAEAVKRCIVIQRETPAGSPAV